jgi:uncharacterized protein (TIGR02118 family)
MIKATVMYPTTEGGKFDLDYYLATHMPMAASRLGDACKGWSVDEGLNAGAPGTPPPYVVMTNMLFDSIEDFGAAFNEAAADIMADLVNFTDILPSFQVSEVRP